eukprot:CAMPEP_0114490400 /NCGR_PEP_ID=MMETSP0109-20121206/2426_1 /TAXON_ID=29199 /ORGANISM="Chlorarachnion reptans, Strain CCCM449" /LENGTH=136 /DNA_ID=CAMNT_0001667023 /DNA_START=164 /DNA_END=574 /DNA_ORIENTATION=+
MEKLDGYNKFSKSLEKKGPQPVGSRKRVVEYRLLETLRLLDLNRLPEESARTRLDFGMAIDGKGKEGTKRDVSPIKAASSIDAIRETIEGENLDGWVFSNTVCLKDSSVVTLIDDDKKSGLAQQLLTDMFSKMSMK